MSGFGVVESEWRKVSNCAEAVEVIREKYLRLLGSMESIAAQQARYVPGLQMQLDKTAGTAALNSFAGESAIRLGWDASGEELAGVAVFTCVKFGCNEPIVTLKIRIPAWTSDAVIKTENGEEVKTDSFRPGDFSYIALMTAVRKQVDLSSR